MEVCAQNWLTRARAMKSLTCLFAALAVAVATEGPVGKVVNLLEDLKNKIENDAEMDEKDFKEHECWCKKVQESKTEMIEEGKKVVKVKESEIVEGKAKEDTLEKEIEETKEEVEENEESQAKGTKVRDTEHDENTQQIEEGESLMDGIKQVSKVFDKPSLVQLRQSKASRYSPKAQTIQGILQNQFQQTESDVKEVSKEEKTATNNFKDWMTDMKEQLNILEDKKSDEEKEEVETEVEIAEDTETKVDTEEQVKADAAFLKEAESSCAARKGEYLNRTELRSIELGGINKGLEILDAKRELLSKTFKGSFLQLSATSATSATLKLQSALEVLKAKAQQTQSARLALVVSEVQNALPEGAFTTVLAEIEKMFEKLKGEAASDKKKKDHCKSEYHSITKKSNNYAFLIQKQTAEIETLETLGSVEHLCGRRWNKMSELESEKAAAAAEVAEIDADMDKAKNLRIKANNAFLKAKADDETGMAVLKETADAISAYYEKHAQAAEASFVEYDPDKLSDKRKQLKNEEKKYTLSKADSQKGAADSVLALIERLVQNLGTEIKDAQADEAKAQTDFEKEQKLLQTGKAKLSKKIASIEGMLATHASSKEEAELAQTGTKTDFKAQKDYKASIQERLFVSEECDFILENFDDRAADRAGEMEDLTRAKELLSGASLVQEQKAPVPLETKEKGSLIKYLGLAKICLVSFLKNLLFLLKQDTLSLWFGDTSVSMAKHILCTGGAGYIGSHTVVKLTENGFKVSIMDNLLNSSEKVLPRLQELTGKETPFFKTDMCDAEAVDKLFAEQKFDGVIHFAGLKVWQVTSALSESLASAACAAFQKPTTPGKYDATRELGRFSTMSSWTVAAVFLSIFQVTSSELLALSVSSSSPGQIDVLWGSAAVSAGASGAAQTSCGVLDAWMLTVTEASGGSPMSVDAASLEPYRVEANCNSPVPAIEGQTCQFTLTSNTQWNVEVLEDCNDTQARDPSTASVFVLGQPASTPNIQITDVSETSLSLSWSSAGDGDCVFQNWQADWQVYGSGSWMQMENGTGTSLVMTGLQANSVYELRVQQVCTAFSRFLALSVCMWVLAQRLEFLSSATDLRDAELSKTVVEISFQFALVALTGRPPLGFILGVSFAFRFRIVQATLSRMDVAGGWGQQLWLQCQASSVSGFTATFTEVQAPAPLSLELHEATRNTMKAKYRLGYIIDDVATCDCATLSLELSADGSGVWTQFRGQDDSCTVIGTRDCFLIDVMPDTKYWGRMKMSCDNSSVDSEYTYSQECLLLADGGTVYCRSYCSETDEACCVAHGGRIRCPASTPFMCHNTMDCADSQDRCCMATEEESHKSERVQWAWRSSNLRGSGQDAFVDAGRVAWASFPHCLLGAAGIGYSSCQFLEWRVAISQVHIYGEGEWEWVTDCDSGNYDSRTCTIENLLSLTDYNVRVWAQCTVVELSSYPNRTTVAVGTRPIPSVAPSALYCCDQELEPLRFYADWWPSNSEDCVFVAWQVDAQLLPRTAGFTADGLYEEAAPEYKIRVRETCTDPLANSPFFERYQECTTLTMPAFDPTNLTAYDEDLYTFEVSWEPNDPKACIFQYWDIQAKINGTDWPEGDDPAVFGCRSLVRTTTNCTVHVGINSGVAFEWRIREACTVRRLFTNWVYYDGLVHTRLPVVPASQPENLTAFSISPSHDISYTSLNVSWEAWLQKESAECRANPRVPFTCTITTGLFSNVYYDMRISETCVDPNAAGETLIVYNIARTRPVPAVAPILVSVFATSARSLGVTFVPQAAGQCVFKGYAMQWKLQGETEWQSNEACLTRMPDYIQTWPEPAQVPANFTFVELTAYNATFTFEPGLGLDCTWSSWQAQMLQDIGNPRTDKRAAHSAHSAYSAQSPPAMAIAPSSAVTLTGAEQAVRAGIAAAQKSGWKVTVAICDAGGNLIALQRMDGCMPIGAEIATEKARSAILFSRETKLLEAAVNGEKSNGGERAALLTSGRVLMEGGVPIIDPAHGKIIGACGVSGVKPQEDAEVAKAAVNSLFPQAKL
eukprot:s996_g8.t1